MNSDATNTSGPDNNGAARKTEERIDMSTVPQEPKTSEDREESETLEDRERELVALLDYCFARFGKVPADAARAHGWKPKGGAA